jgi:hypothetical protein
MRRRPYLIIAGLVGAFGVRMYAASGAVMCNAPTPLLLDSIGLGSAAERVAVEQLVTGR